MAVIYVKEQGSCLQKRGERLVVTKGGNTLLDIPISSIDNIAVIGNVQITTQILLLLMENGIDVNYFTFGGKYIGQTSSDRSKNIFLRFAQYELYNNLEERLKVARIIVENKINNQITMIRHFLTSKEYPNRNLDIEQMENLKNELPLKISSNEVMGIEGMCSNIYFGCFGYMFDCDFEFHGRNRRPPKDPINVLISLGYTLLTKEVSSALDAESFEMYLGFLHGIRYGRKSLALDIIEEFRQPIIDHMVINMCNKRMMNKYDFEEDENGIILTEHGFHKFCTEYEKWMRGERGINYRTLIHRQVALLKSAVQKKELYQPYRMEK